MHSPAGYTPLSEIANSLRNSFAVAWPNTRISKEIEALGSRGLLRRRQNLDLLYGELAYFAALKNVYACDTTVQLVKLDATRLFTRCSPQRSDDSARWSRSVVHLLQYVFVEPTTYTISLTTWDNIAEDQKQSFGEDESGHLSQTANSLRTFEGWSLCCPTNKVTDTSVFCSTYLAKYAPASDYGKRGRPPKARAQEAFAAMGYEKGSHTWEQLSRKIEELTGEKPSPKSLRNWAKNKSK